MKKAVKIIVLSTLGVIIGYLAFIYFIPYSEGVRSGELIKISRKGVMFKTWEGEISQGISGAQIFSFSVEGSKKDILEKLEELQGRYVKVNYKERFSTLFWLGDTKYFITAISEERSPHIQN